MLRDLFDKREKIRIVNYIDDYFNELILMHKMVLSDLSEIEIRGNGIVDLSVFYFLLRCHQDIRKEEIKSHFYRFILDYYDWSKVKLERSCLLDGASFLTNEFYQYFDLVNPKAIIKLRKEYKKRLSIGNVLQIRQPDEYAKLYSSCNMIKNIDNGLMSKLFVQASINYSKSANVGPSLISSKILKAFEVNRAIIDNKISSYKVNGL